MEALSGGALALAQLMMALVTAGATVALWYVTRVLAVETRRMAERTAQPNVVATLEPNRWSQRHFDLKVTNTGNAVAYDISLAFEPPLKNGEAREDFKIPFQAISILKPDQTLSSYVCDYQSLDGVSFTVTIGWKRAPTDKNTETLSYVLSMNDYSDVSRLGAFDPATQIAEQIKKIRDDWDGVALGQQRVKVDVFTQEDRAKAQEDMAARFAARKDHQEATAKSKNEPGE